MADKKTTRKQNKPIQKQAKILENQINKPTSRLRSRNYRPVGDLNRPGSQKLEGRERGLEATKLTSRIGRRSPGDVEQKAPNRRKRKPVLGRKHPQVAGLGLRERSVGVDNGAEKISKKRIKPLTVNPLRKKRIELFKIKTQFRTRRKNVTGYKKKNKIFFVKKKMSTYSKHKRQLVYNSAPTLPTKSKVRISPYKHSKFFNRDRLPEWANESISRDSFFAKQELRDLLGGLGPVRPRVTPPNYKPAAKWSKLDTNFQKKRTTRVEKFFRQLLQPKLT